MMYVISGYKMGTIDPVKSLHLFKLTDLGNLSQNIILSAATCQYTSIVVI